MCMCLLMLILFKDGVLTREEMAEVLQTVLKRELTLEEAMAIAQDMVSCLDHRQVLLGDFAPSAQYSLHSSD